MGKPRAVPVPQRDIAHIPVQDWPENDATRLGKFLGAVHLAEQQGHRVEIRALRGTRDQVHSIVASIPAEAFKDG